MVQQTTTTTTATSATENAITIDSIKSQLSNFPKLTEYLSYFVHLSEAIPASKQNLTENGADSEDEEDDISSSKYWKQTSTENKQNLKFLQKTNQKVKKANGDDNESDGEDDDDEEEEGQEVINGKSLIDDEAAEDDDSVSDEDDGSDESSDDEEERITTQKSKQQQQKSQPKKNRKTNDNMIFNALKTGDVASATTKHSVLTNGASATATGAAQHDKNAVDAAPSANSKKRKNRPLTAEQLLKEKQSKKQKLIEQSDVNPQKAINDYTRDQLESAMIRSEHGRDNKAVKVLQSKVKKERAKKKKSKKEWDQRVKNQSTQQQQKIEKRAANIRAKKSRGKKEEPPSSSSSNATAAAAANKTQKRNRPGFEGKRGKPINGINKLKNIQQQSKQQQKK